MLNLVCQDILKKLKATASELEIQELAAETHILDNEEAETEARDLELGYRQPIKRRRVSRAQTNRRTKIAPETLNCWAKLRWITGKLRQQQHLIRCLQRYITRFTADGTRMIRPVLDVPTRWNSFYYMLRNFSQSRRAIEAVIRRYPRDFLNLQITDSDWLLIHDVRKTLGYIAALSEFFEGSRSYPTLSSALPMIGRLFGILDDAIQSEGLKKSLKEAYLAGREKLEKYFPRIPDLSDRTLHAYMIATILDPRFKLQGLRGPQ